MRSPLPPASCAPTAWPGPRPSAATLPARSTARPPSTRPCAATTTPAGTCTRSSPWPAAHQGRPGPVPASDPFVRALVTSPRIATTASHGCDPAADLASGRLDLRVQSLLAVLAERHTIRLSCLRTGHSRFVKGTTRVSNHTVWRAVDIDRVDGRPVGRSSGPPAPSPCGWTASRAHCAPPRSARRSCSATALLHRRGPPGPHPHRLQRPPRLTSTRRSRRRRRSR